MEHRKTIYRVAIEGLHCRSSVELVTFRISALEGVEAASIDADHTLVVFADAAVVSADDIVRTLIDVGVVPRGNVFAPQVPALETQLVLDAREAPELEATAVEPPDAVHESAEAIAESHEAGAEELEAADEPPKPVAVHAEVSAGVPAVVAAAEAPTLHAPGHGSAALPRETTFAAKADEPPSLTPSDSQSAEESIRTAMEAPVVAASPRASLVQQIKVAVSDDYYPSRIEVIPGVPVDIEFGEGHGCLATVLFADFGIEEDLTQGGTTIHLPGLAPGIYQFSCGMHMVFGTVVAEA